MRLLVSRLVLLSVGILFSCASYKQNIMFRLPDGFKPDVITKEALSVEKNYIVQHNDYLKLEVYSNKGEKLIDPNPELSNLSANQNVNNKEEPNYLVDINGLVKFPMIGELQLEGLTLRQAEEIIQKEYQKYFKEPFALLTYTNKRVIVLGAPGGQVIPLNNQNISLVEVLGMAKGVDNFAKAQNIRVLRKDKVFLIDLSTIDGYKDGNMLIESGDIVYIEPVRRPVSEAFRDYAGIVGLAVSVYTLIIVANK
ncbi:MAG: polysaccharide biosynthesis/export family protein [Bacteroidia bacterium]|nr:polysaccharide biosynthesis/export family protein [Bacteroidia bacterium]